MKRTRSGTTKEVVKSRRLYSSTRLRCVPFVYRWLSADQNGVGSAQSQCDCDVRTRTMYCALWFVVSTLSNNISL